MLNERALTTLGAPPQIASAAIGDAGWGPVEMVQLEDDRGK
jgi:hypothetical protein